MIGEKVELRLENTSTEDVLLILEDRLKNSRIKSQARQFISDSYADGITRTITTHDHLNSPRRENNKITIQGTSYQERFPSKEDLTAAEILNFPLTYDALIFAVFQIQLDVLLRLEYSQQWHEFVDSVMSDLDSLFHKQPSQVTPIPIDLKAQDKAAQAVDSIVAIKPDEQIRLNHTTGNFQPGLYPSEAKDAIIKVTSDTLAGLTENAASQAPKVDAANPEKPKQKGRYRLTSEETRFRRQKVKAAEKIKKQNPQKQWKEIDKAFADELNISERTFRSWRHNNY